MINEIGRYACLRCGLSYKQKGHLSRHIKYECGVEPKFICKFCNRGFKHRNHLTVHISVRHCKNIL